MTINFTKDEKDNINQLGDYDVRSVKCMIKIFRGAGVVTPSKPPYQQLLPLPTPCFKMFLERSLTGARDRMVP